MNSSGGPCMVVGLLPPGVVTVPLAEALRLLRSCSSRDDVGRHRSVVGVSRVITRHGLIQMRRAHADIAVIGSKRTIRAAASAGLKYLQCPLRHRTQRISQRPINAPEATLETTPERPLQEPVVAAMARIAAARASMAPSTNLARATTIVRFLLTTHHQ